MELFEENRAAGSEEVVGLPSAAVAMDVDPDGPGGVGGRERSGAEGPEYVEG